MTNIYAEVYRRHSKRLTPINVPIQGKKATSIVGIFYAVADYYRLPVSAIMVHNRKYEIAEARQMAWKLTRDLTSVSLKAIGEYSFNKPFDHTTVLYGIKAIQNRIDTEPIVKDRYNEILTIIKNRK